MLSTESVTPLSLELCSSRRLALYVLVTHAVAAFVLLLLPLSAWHVGGILTALLLSGVRNFRLRASLRSDDAVVGVNRNADGTWLLRSLGGSTQHVRLLSDSYLHPELLVLNFEAGSGKRRSVVLAYDSTDRDSLRRLRVHLALESRLTKE